MIIILMMQHQRSGSIVLGTSVRVGVSAGFQRDYIGLEELSSCMIIDKIQGTLKL